MGKCKDCKFYEPECQYQEGDPIRWKKWGNCKNQKLKIDGDFVNAGADDDYGAFWHITGEFGCILFEPKECETFKVYEKPKPDLITEEVAEEWKQ